jgi:hypothetical protein
MVSPLSPINFGPSEKVDLVGSYLAGRQGAQAVKMNDQAIQQNDQQISRSDYDQAIQRLSVINRLATKARSLSQNERAGFTQSINHDMLKSVGIDPAQITSVGLDDQSLDALIAQTGTAIPNEYQQNRVQSSTKFKNGTIQQVLANGKTRTLDPSGHEVAGPDAKRVMDEANQYEIGNSTQKSGSMADAKNKSDLNYAGGIENNKKLGELNAVILQGGSAKEAESLGAGRGKNIAENEGAAVKADKISGNLLDNIAEARKIIPLATGSGAGTVRDAAGRLIGVTTESAKNAAKLDTLAGWMAANVPRMEGPQSDKDVESYRSMAGRVGNREIPTEERLAALDVLETLQKRYSEKNKAAVGGSQSNQSQGGSTAKDRAAQLRQELGL